MTTRIKMEDDLKKNEKMEDLKKREDDLKKEKKKEDEPINQNQPNWL